MLDKQKVIAASTTYEEQPHGERPLRQSNIGFDEEKKNVNHSDGENDNEKNWL